MSDAALMRAGYADARAVTKRHAKSFYLASFVLFGARRRAAFALYAFCRRLDDLVDEGGRTDLPEVLARARAGLSALYRRFPALADSVPPSAAAELPIPAAERAALEDTIERFQIPERPFRELLDGFEMDLVLHRYQTTAQLELYCHRVAGVVGLMLAPVLGCREPAALAHAAELGRAMQLTNILRDVEEDRARGRVYLPADALARFGISEGELLAGRVTDRWVAFMQAQIAEARAAYARALEGASALAAFGAPLMVRLMATLYGGILQVIEERGYDVFSGRASLSLPRKLLLAAQVVLGLRGAGVERPRLLRAGGGRGPATLVLAADATERDAEARVQWATSPSRLPLPLREAKPLSGGRS